MKTTLNFHPALAVFTGQSQDVIAGVLNCSNAGIDYLVIEMKFPGVSNRREIPLFQAIKNCVSQRIHRHRQPRVCQERYERLRILHFRCRK